MRVMRTPRGFQYARAAVLASAAAIAWGMVSCSSGEVPIGDQDGKTDPGWDPADDPGAPRTMPDLGPYGYCSNGMGFDADGAYVSQCPQTGYDGWITGDGTYGCLCTIDCTSESDCPDPGSGTAVPICDTGACALPCDQGEVCPDGMECVAARTGPRFCGWLEDESDAYEAVVESCTAYTTRESCEQRLRELDRQPAFACVWAKETIYSASGADCEEALTEEKCIAAEYRGSLRTGWIQPLPVPNRCAPDAPPLYWADRGGGTFMLLTLFSDYYRAYGPDMPRAACEFGDITLPLACECGC